MSVAVLPEFFKLKKEIKMSVKREKLIVLKTFPFKESDLIVRGLSVKGLQMSFVARGARKSKKRFAGGVLEPFSFIEAEYRSGRRAAMHSLRRARMLKDFYGLRADWGRLQTAFYVLKTADSLSLEGESENSAELFALVGSALTEAQTSRRLDTLKLFFQIKLLFLQGVLPARLARKDILNKTLKEHENFTLSGAEEKRFSEQTDEVLNRYLHL